MGTDESTQVSELRELIGRWTKDDGDHQTAIPSLCLIRYSSCLTSDSGFLSPSLCVCAQGQGQVVLGAETYCFAPVTISFPPWSFQLQRAFWAQLPPNHVSG
jgi:hypothetical protein